MDLLRKSRGAAVAGSRPKPMSRNRQELHRMVREAMEKGYGTHYGAYVATLPRPEPSPPEAPELDMESFLGEEDDLL